MRNLSLGKKIAMAVAGFIVLILIVSAVYLALNPPPPNNNNPGGTGGDYSPPNSVYITNDGVLYNYIGSANTVEIESIIKTAVLYDISVSNDPVATPDYTQSSVFDASAAQLYKKNSSYNVVVDSGKISSPDHTPWHYAFTMTTNDGRHFSALINVTPDPETHLFSIKKTI